MRIVRVLIAAIMIVTMWATVNRAEAAAFFAVPAFEQQWQQGEALTPNFWGPLATAKDGQTEPYTGATSGPICRPDQACPAYGILNQRTVQYFDKGRMEMTNGSVTNGLLTKELVTGNIQTGDTTFEPRPLPHIAIAGDLDARNPAYDRFVPKAAALFAPAQPRIGENANVLYVNDTVGLVPGNPAVGIGALSVYDDATQHNVHKVFADYRAKAGSAAIGLAISEPFGVSVYVRGQLTVILIQFFERRALTYTGDNPDPFKVEMGNIGQQYALWRYPTATPTAASPPLAAPVMPTIGQPAPDFSVTAKDGAVLTQSALSGKATLVFFFAWWCPHCQAEAPRIRDLALTMPDVQFIAIGVGDRETPNDAYDFQTTFHLPFPTYADGGKAAHAYGVAAYPTLVAVDKTGIVRAVTQGEVTPDGLMTLVTQAKT